MKNHANEAVIDVDGLEFSYPNGQRIFENLTLAFETGRFYLVRGASGAGKSTLLRLLIRLEDPTGGIIRFEGRNLTEYPPERLRRRILYIQQTPTVAAGSVRDNLMMPFGFRANSHLPRPDNDQLNQQLHKFLLADVGLETEAKSLSVGQLQRLCLIRGLLLAPQVVLLDEPASALDETSRGVVEGAAEELCATHGLTVIMVSHRRFDPTVVNPKIFELKRPAIEGVT